MRGYMEENIWNADEWNWFCEYYLMAPSPFKFDNEKGGGRGSKESITALFTTREKKDVLVIGKHQKPCYFITHYLSVTQPVIVHWWLGISLLSSWGLKDWDWNLGQDRKNCFEFFDNCTAHDVKNTSWSSCARTQPSFSSHVTRGKPEKLMRGAELLQATSKKPRRRRRVSLCHSGLWWSIWSALWLVWLLCWFYITL